jgi:hypothetical protein
MSHLRKNISNEALFLPWHPRAETSDLHSHSCESWVLNRTHVLVTHLPVEEPSTAFKSGHLAFWKAQKALRGGQGSQFKDLSLTLIRGHLC